MSIDRDDEKASACFIDGFIRKMGDGSKIRFWEDVWLGNSSLMTDFPRLFNLTRSQDSLITDLKLANVDGWALQWRKPTFGRALDELGVLENILKNVFIPYNKANHIIWKHNLAGYCTKQA
ncbi:hypothetical protein SLA2020_017090 [Shorea laevis]